MNPTLDAALRSWPFDPGLLIALLATGGVYLRGWWILHRRDPRRWHVGRLAAFLGGLGTIYLALASPIEPFASLLLQVHMVQHLLLMMVAPPLLWLGAPLFPFLRGLPRPILVHWVAPLFSSPVLRSLSRRLVHPFTALLLFLAATWVWHLPPVYNMALRSSVWHYAQHLCFLGSALLFWYPVVRPEPSVPLWSAWLLFPYLIFADLSNTVLSAWMTFSGRVLYPYYLEVPRLGGVSALEDQSAAGVFMWVPGSIAFLLPLLAIGVRLLSGESAHSRPRPAPTTHRGRFPLPILGTVPAPVARFDLLRVPVLGRFLKWRYARMCFQVPLAIVAGVIVYDGFHGPQVGAMNLAGVLPWVHWRGLLILGLLVAGNVFCMGCPFLLPRTLARRWLPPGWNWPRMLRNKWPAIGLLIVFLWAYEALSLWDRPLWTACLVLGYFLGAFVVDGLFRGASFCKYVCPIGQFNFVQSLASPLEVQVRDPDVCAGCHTRDCIRGRDGIPGCELHLFLPRKGGNMDCTLCLDCVHACPHDNVGIMPTTPGAALWDDVPRSGVGRWSRRPDIAALVLVLVFGAFANAAGMVGPVVKAQDQLAELTGVHAPMLMTTVFYLLALVVVPLGLTALAAELSRHWGRWSAGTLEVATRCTYALVPLGFGMWLAHYSFHFLTGYDAALPVTTRFAADLGLTALGGPVWNCDCCRPLVPWLLPLEIVFLDLGLLLSLYAGFRVTPNLKALIPWAVLMGLLFGVGLWILFQPMQMRGTLS
jgi:cytochrome c oxidase assembly factor CtaG